MNEVNREVKVYDGSLACPRCGTVDGLHHTETFVFDRDDGDDNCTVTIVGRKFTTISRDAEVEIDNPSSYRNGVVILFWCEFCDEPEEVGAKLNISQHKGTTHMYWEDRWQ